MKGSSKLTEKENKLDAPKSKTKKKSAAKNPKAPTAKSPEKAPSKPSNEHNQYVKLCTILAKSMKFKEMLLVFSNMLEVLYDYNYAFYQNVTVKCVHSMAFLLFSVQHKRREVEQLQL